MILRTLTTTIGTLPTIRRSPLEAVATVRDRLRRFPMPVIALGLRVGVAMVFWKSAMTKLASWDITVQLFADEYRVPLLPAEVAAYLGTANELIGSVLLILGLGARLGAAALLGLTAVIQLFVYPENWADHLFWAAALAYVLTRGPGKLSLDHLLARRFLGEG